MAYVPFLGCDFAKPAATPPSKVRGSIALAFRSVALVCFGGGSATSVTGPLEVFRHAASRPGGAGRGDAPAVSVLTPGDEPVTFGGCVTVRPTAGLGAIGRPDLVFFTGMAADDALGWAPPHDRGRELDDWLRTAREGGAAIAAVCPSQAPLAGLGLLDDRPAAVHWSLLEKFRARWPAVGWSADRVVLEEDGFYTCCGASSALDLAFYLVDRLLGPEAMAESARWLLADPPRVRQGVPPPLFAAAAGTPDPAMAPVEAWLRVHFREPIRLEELAARFGMSWRTFHRRFRVAFGEPPRAYVQKLRLAAARLLLEAETIPVEQVARQVGYEDPAFFRALFKRHTGMAASEYRERFRFRAAGGTGPAA